MIPFFALTSGLFVILAIAFATDLSLDSLKSILILYLVATVPIALATIGFALTR